MKKIFFILFYFIYVSCFAEIKILNFNKEIEITDFGKKVNVKIKAQVNLQDRKYYYKGWDYIFDPKQTIQISSAEVVGKKFKTLFGNNTLKFEFDKAFNGDILEFNFKYLEYDNKTNKYTRHEYISLPSFAKNASGELKIIIPTEYIVYSLNPNFKQNANIYTWIGKINDKGFSDIFDLTLKKATWKAEILTTVKTEEKISKADIKLPVYFKNGNNIIKDYKIQTNYDKNFTKINEKEDEIEVNFNNINGTLLQVKLTSVIENDLINKVWIKLNPMDFLDIEQTLANDLNGILYNISQNNKNEPLHIAIAKFVNNFIKYNETYYGKELTSREILNIGEGVCSHYAQLYNDLLKTAGIPSIVVSGMSYNTEKNNFENHAWNLVYTNGEWLSIDTTWGIYSGIVPISHIFFYLDAKDTINYTLYNTNNTNFLTDIKRNVEFIDNNTNFYY